MRNIMVLVASLVMPVLLSACLGAIAPIADCTDRVITDVAKGWGIAQIVADVSGPCGLDAAAVIAMVLGNSDKTHGSRAYLEAMRAHEAVIK